MKWRVSRYMKVCEKWHISWSVSPNKTEFKWVKNNSTEWPVHCKRCETQTQHNRQKPLTLSVEDLVTCPAGFEATQEYSPACFLWDWAMMRSDIMGEG